MLKGIAHMENQKNMESHSHRNGHDENPYTKCMESHLLRICMTKTQYNEMVVIRTEMSMTEINSKRDGSHSYRSINGHIYYTTKRG